jgi:carbon storage regulator CsrA
MVGDDRQVTVLRVRGTRALIVASRLHLVDRLSTWEESRPKWFAVGEMLFLGDKGSCCVMDVRAENVRLGFTFPPTVKPLRKEVYEAIQRERQGGENLLP